MSEPGGFVPAGSDPASARELLTGMDEVTHDYLDQNAAPPTPADMPTVVVAEEAPPEPVINLLRTRSYTLMTAWEPTLILPSDPNRKSVIILAVLESGFVYVSDSRLGLNAANRTAGVGVFRLVSNVAITLDAYNGPLWAWSDTDNAVVNAIAVTV